MDKRFYVLGICLIISIFCFIILDERAIITNEKVYIYNNIGDDYIYDLETNDYIITDIKYNTVIKSLSKVCEPYNVIHFYNCTKEGKNIIKAIKP